MENNTIKHPLDEGIENDPIGRGNVSYDTELTKEDIEQGKIGDDETNL